MARVRLCVCGSWFVGREGQAAHPRAPGQCLHFECRGAPARVRVWRCEGRPPLPHHLCVWRNLSYLTLERQICLSPSPWAGALDLVSPATTYSTPEVRDSRYPGEREDRARTAAIL